MPNEWAGKTLSDRDAMASDPESHVGVTGFFWHVSHVARPQLPLLTGKQYRHTKVSSRPLIPSIAQVNVI